MPWFWIGFIVLVLLLLALDLGVLNRKAHVIAPGEALGWSAFWIALALVFNIFIFQAYERHWLGIGLNGTEVLDGGTAALQFFTAYVVEKSLSLDNIFVIAMIFGWFKVPAMFQHRVLFWGILGALVLRGAMILAGTALIQRFSWSIYLFGALLIFTAIRMLVTRHEDVSPEKNWMVRLFRRFMPTTTEYHGQNFLVRQEGVLTATPLFLALVMVESADIMFAVDSIPAVFAVTRDPFLVFTSNVFALLGLRSLYFALAAVMDKFRYLKISLVFVLGFVGVKMMLAHVSPVPPLASLAIIGAILGIGVIASLMAGSSDPAALKSPLQDELPSLLELTRKHMRRALVLIFGSTILVVGVALLFLPGPGIPMILGGLALLSLEFLWARRWSCRLRQAVGMKPCKPENPEPPETGP